MADSSQAGGAPELSVVVPYVNDPSDLQSTLGALAGEAARRRLQVLVVDRVGGAGELVGSLPWAQVIPVSPGTPIPAMRARGFESATAPAVAVIEDHVLVPPGWAEQLLAAWGRGELVVGGAVRNAATDRLVDWAAFLTEYSQLLPPLPAGSVGGLPGNNTLYDRGLLDRYRATIAEGGWEDRLHGAIKADGGELFSHPELVIGHKMHYTIWLYTSQRYLYSRSFAGARLRGAPLARRLAMGLASFALPPILFGRIVTTVWGKGQHRGELLKSLPLIAWFTLAWAAGEIIGYWLGEGDAFGRVR